MLSPKRTKFRKQHRGRMRGVASKGILLPSVNLPSKLKTVDG